MSKISFFKNNTAPEFRSPCTVHRVPWLPGKEGTLPNSGFDARGAGYFDQATNRYYNLMGNTYFWTVNPPTGGGTTSSVEYNYYCDLPRISESLKTMGYSIRCIRKK